MSYKELWQQDTATKWISHISIIADVEITYGVEACIFNRIEALCIQQVLYHQYLLTEFVIISATS
jgi:hypothetical protein